MTKASLQAIRKGLDRYVGSQIRLRANNGRQKIVEKEGVLEGTYPNLFVIKLAQDSQAQKRVSYTYSDILTKTVELVIYGKNGEIKFDCAAK